MPRAKALTPPQTDTCCATAGAGEVAHCIVADIGGTHARFAKVDAQGKLSTPITLACAKYSGLGDALAAYLAQDRLRTASASAGKGDSNSAAASVTHQIDTVVIALAAPIQADQITMTNNHWSFSARALKFAWTAAWGLRRLVILNDFSALALSLSSLKKNDLRQTGGTAAAPRAPLALLGAGTGLGVSALLPLGAHKLALAGEGGHVTLAATNAQEEVLLAILRRQWGHVSAERILSGPGLEALHGAMMALPTSPGAAQAPRQTSVRQTAAQNMRAPQISAAAAAGDTACIATLKQFCAFLGNVAGNLALTLGARGGVYIGGGIVPALGPAYDSDFRTAFATKGRFSAYLATIPSYVITAAFPALIGAAQFIGGEGVVSSADMIDLAD